MARDVMLNVRCTEQEKDAFDRAAKDAGMDRSEWARVILRCAAGFVALRKQLARVFHP